MNHEDDSFQERGHYSLIKKIIRDHKTAKFCDDSYDRYSRSVIISLKDLGYLDCYFDFESRKDMIFATDKGLNFCDLCDAYDRFDKARSYVARFGRGECDFKSFSQQMESILKASDVGASI